MKIKEELNLEVLLSYGFEKIDKEEERENEQYYIASNDYKFNVGHARRGQFYYLLISEETRIVSIYSTEPDGSGGSVNCPNVLIKMIIDGIIVE